jgi:hypothetical protein
MLSFADPRGPLALPGATYSTIGQQIIYVHSSGAAGLAGLPEGMNENFRTSVASALSLCRSGRGDVIQLLPGHTESISTADHWSNLGSKTGVTILGPLTGPPAVFTWTATASTVLVNGDAEHFCIDGGPNRNIRLNFDPGSGSVNVTAPITVSEAGFKLRNVTCRFATDSNSKCTIGITTTADADDMEIYNCHFFGATTGEVTTFLHLVGTDRLRLVGNVFEGATSAVGVGIVRHATTAGTESQNIFCAFNTYINRKASSTAAVTGLAGVTGTSIQELFHYLDNSSTTMWITSPGDMAYYNPRTVNLAGEAGMLSTVVST